MLRWIFGLLLITLSLPSYGQVSARLFRYADVSQNRIAFVYGGDIWIAPLEGGTAARLSTPPGEESFPRFSPDGKWIAYTANYHGNPDVYLIPTEGGTPQRLTAHPDAERMLDWYPDGKHLLIASPMQSGRRRFNQLYRLSTEGGLPEKLPLAYGEFGAISPDGRYLAFTIKTRDFRTWKGYRGGWAPDIWLYDTRTQTAQNITQDNANDSQPMWHGQTLYFLSDRGEEMRYNIWAYDIKTGTFRQITHFTEYDVHFPGMGPDHMVFEAGGDLYLMNMNDESYRKISIKVISDQRHWLPRTEKVANLIMDYNLSPKGQRILINARGEVFSLPARKGAIYNLTQTSGVAERYPAWSPDGQKLAYWSDQNGEYQLVVRNKGGQGPEQVLTNYHDGFRYRLYWSPDGKKLAFIDKAMQIHVLNVDTREDRIVDQGLWMYHGALNAFRPNWSPDSRYLVYARGLPNRHRAIFLYDTQANTRHQLTSGFYNDDEPAFDPDGKYLYFLTDRHFQPLYSSLQNTWIYANTTRLAAVPLRADIPSPLAPENDTLAIQADTSQVNKKDGNTRKAFTIELEGFEARTVLLPPEAGNYDHVEATSGKVLFIERPRTGSAERKSLLRYYDLKERETKTILEDLSDYRLSADGKHVLVHQRGTFAVISVAPNQKIKEKVPTDNMEMTLYPREEWRQIFREAWRLSRDYFYDPNLHGVDWEAERRKYEPLIEQAASRSDVNFILGELIAELNASHTYRRGGDIEQGLRHEIGLLGVDWETNNGFYRIKRILHGAPWDAEVRSPLDAPGIQIREGTYVLAVNGRPLRAPTLPWEVFDGLAGETVELTVNDRPEETGSWNVIVQLLRPSEEQRLRYLSWVESQRQIVEKASEGKVGYVYVPNTGIDGQNELVRQFLAQMDRPALLIDERFNSGGQIPDRFIELLDRKPLAFWAVRDGAPWQTPFFAHFGPKAMLINGWSGSGGDAFPYYFRERKLGPLVGMRTWGGLIGITGVPELIDGGSITVPTFRMYSPEGKWFEEGHGVEPDVPVPEAPVATAKGRDPQLLKGIDVLLEALKEHPSLFPPPYPPYEKRNVGHER